MGVIMKRFFAAIAAFTLAPAGAFAQEWYAGGYFGLNLQGDSDNRGQLTSDFSTGNGAPTIPTETVLAQGTSVGWTTDFDSGVAYGVEAGLRFDNGFRSGVEISLTQADVDTHEGVNVGGAVIDGVDAAVLTGSAEPLGATVGEVVSDGRGDIENLAVFANAYYDFNRDGQFQPYVGAGIGFSDVNVTYNPSGVGIVDDGETKFAYQLRAGATYQFSEQVEAYAEYTYRATEDAQVNVDLFPGALDIENEQNLLTVGVRYRFSG